MSDDFSDSKSNYGKAAFYRKSSEDLAGELNLQPGEVLHAEVDTVLPGENKRLLLNLKGRQVVAASKPRVRPGDSLVVKVVSVQHPVELKIYRPSEAGEQLSSGQLDRVIGSMGIRSSSPVNRLARSLLEQGVPLTAELLGDLNSRDDLLGDNSGNKISPEKLRSAVFLQKRGLPLRSSLISRLTYLPQNKSSIDWSFLGKALFADFRGQRFSLFESVRLMGLDLVNQLFKDPNFVSKTVHAKLLKSTSLGVAGFKKKQSLAVVLALALHNCLNDNQLNMLLPLPGNEFFDHLHIFISISSTPGREKLSNWNSRILLHPRSALPLGIDLVHKKKFLEVELCTESDKLMNRSRRKLNPLLNSTKESGYRIRFRKRHGEPGKIPDPLALIPEDLSGVSGGVDFMA